MGTFENIPVSLMSVICILCLISSGLLLKSPDTGDYGQVHNLKLWQLLRLCRLASWEGQYEFTFSVV